MAYLRLCEIQAPLIFHLAIAAAYIHLAASLSPAAIYYTIPYDSDGAPAYFHYHSYLFSL
jgi:hypothetical protein